MITVAQAKSAVMRANLTRNKEYIQERARERSAQLAKIRDDRKRGRELADSAYLMINQESTKGLSHIRIRLHQLELDAAAHAIRILRKPDADGNTFTVKLLSESVMVSVDNRQEQYHLFVSW